MKCRHCGDSITDGGTLGFWHESPEGRPRYLCSKKPWPGRYDPRAHGTRAEPMTKEDYIKKFKQLYESSRV